MNRKPLRNQASLAQPAISGNGLYSTAGHLFEFDRFLRRTPRRKFRGPPCLTADTAYLWSPAVPFHTGRLFSAVWPSTLRSISNLLGVLFRLPSSAVFAQFAITTPLSPIYDPRPRMR